MMFKWEKKLIEQVDKWMPQLVFVLVTIVALLIRRQGIWHMSFDYANQFYREAPGYLHTPFYSGMIVLISYIPKMPIHTLKWIISGFDFAVAVLCTLWLKDQFGKNPEGNVLQTAGNVNGEGSEKTAGRTAALVCYSLLLVSPLVIAYGLVWIHVDAICVSAVLAALLCVKKKRYYLMGAFLGLACALQMQYVVVVGIICVILWQREKSFGSKAWSMLTKFFAVLVPVWAILMILGMVVADVPLQESAYSLINWLIISPATGVTYSGLFEWLNMMLLSYGYLIGIGMIALGFRKPQYGVLVAAIHIGLAIYVAQILQYGY